jgi:hypothetical protein
VCGGWCIERQSRELCVVMSVGLSLFPWKPGAKPISVSYDTMEEINSIVSVDITVSSFDIIMSTYANKSYLYTIRHIMHIL